MRDMEKEHKKLQAVLEDTAHLNGYEGLFALVVLPGEEPRLITCYVAFTDDAQRVIEPISVALKNARNVPPQA